MLIFFVGLTFILTLNLTEDINEYMNLTFKNVDYNANIELIYLFIKVIVTNYALEIGLRYMKFKKLFYWI